MLGNNESGIKKYFGCYTTPLIIAVITLIFAYAFYLFVSNWNEFNNIPSQRQISVVGEGKIAVRPDVVTFTASVITNDKKVKQAQTENAKRSNAIIDYLKSNGIGEKDIKTLYYNIFPQYKSFPVIYECEEGFSCGKNEISKIISYEVRHNLNIKVHDLEKIDDLLDGVVTNGANEISSINFEIDNEELVKIEARQKAISDAKEKAQVLAKNLGVKLKRIISFSESGSYPPIYSRYSKSSVILDESSNTPQIEAGEQEVVSNVTITYEFR